MYPFLFENEIFSPVCPTLHMYPVETVTEIASNQKLFPDLQPE